VLLDRRGVVAGATLRLQVLTLGLALAGCVGREQFDRAYTKAWCSNLQRCAGGTFRELFYDAAAPDPGWRTCEIAVFGELEGVSACLADHCRFRHGAAAQCLRSLNGATCDAFVSGEALESCEAVWTDCDEVGARCRGDEVGDDPTRWWSDSGADSG
jgi:hypothetical protein